MDIADLVKTGSGVPHPCWSDGSALRLADNGYHPLPIKPGTKAPVIRNWSRFCRQMPPPQTIEKWSSPAGQFASWGIGAATGELVAIDIDLLDRAEAMRAQRAAEDAFGYTPLVRIGQPPKRMLFYRTLSPFRSFKVGKIEVLSLGRQAVVFAIHPGTGQPYTWRDETPLDVRVSALPAITEAKAREWLGAADGAKRERSGALPKAREGDCQRIDKGERNCTLFAQGRKLALRAGSYDVFVGQLRDLNQTNCAEPLPDEEMARVAKSVWRYRENGTLFPDDGESRAVVSTSEFENYADTPDGLMLLIFLRLRHGPNASSVAISPGAMSDAGLIGRWSKKRIMTARNLIVEKGNAVLEKEGTGRGHANLYRLV